MMRNIRLHWLFIKLKLAERMAYRVDFFVCFFAYFLWQLAPVVFILVMYAAGGRFAGWTVPQIIVLQGCWALFRGLASTLCMGIIYNTNELVGEGKLDFLLLRPVQTLWLLIMDSFDSEDVGQATGGLLLIIVGIILNHGFSGSLFLFVVFGLLSLLFFLSFALLGSLLAIKFKRMDRYYEFMTPLSILAQYPRDIYTQNTIRTLTVFVPIFAASYFPASALFGIPLNDLFACYTSVILITGIMLIAWHTTLKDYVSAGG